MSMKKPLTSEAVLSWTPATFATSLFVTGSSAVLENYDINDRIIGSLPYDWNRMMSNWCSYERRELASSSVTPGFLIDL